MDGQICRGMSVQDKFIFGTILMIVGCHLLSYFCSKMLGAQQATHTHTYVRTYYFPPDEHTNRQTLEFFE